MTKLYENCQRMVLITYANEMADACAALPTGPIDPMEVSKAAATKPFGYLPMWPSAGVGGHCIPVNPGYLFRLGEDVFPLLRQATETTRLRPRRLADKAMHELERMPRRREGKRKVLVVGVAFKPGQELTTNAPGLAMVEHITEEWDDEVEVSYADPLVAELPPNAPKVDRFDDKLHWNVRDLSEFDAVLCVIKQHGLDLSVLDELSSDVMVVKY
jgi:UDP-N-acetyl-D-mannosaminuronate dehydrogenase